MLAAAANGRRETIRFEPMQHMRVKIEPIGGDGWLISLQLLRADALPNAKFEIFDKRSGAVWLSGVPDGQGVVTAIWDGDGDPRAARAELALRIDDFDIGSDIG
jgi:hypothetical protein